MQNSRYFWSVINPSLFTKEEIIALLHKTEQSAAELLDLRRCMTKAGLPSFQISTSIRELEDVRGLLIMAGYKKFRTSDLTFKEPKALRENCCPNLESRPGWRQRFTAVIETLLKTKNREREKATDTK